MGTYSSRLDEAADVKEATGAGEADVLIRTAGRLWLTAGIAEGGS
jgi:hypothetical protein